MPFDDSDLDVLAATPARPGSKECSVCWALTQLTPETAVKMRAVLDNNNAAAPDVVKAFAKRVEFSIGRDSIVRHRQGVRASCVSA